MIRLKQLLIIAAIAILAGCAGPQTQTGDTVNRATDTSSTLDLTRTTPDLWEHMRRGFAIPNIDTELSRKWTDYYASHPESLMLMTRRASKYLYHVIDELNERGLPTELALLPFVESAYDPAALSRSSASGLWQFLPSTGRYYNLEQDWWKDERRDPIASTAAALDYLDYLYEFQGDWHLALASYNMGEGAVQRAMKENENKDKPTDYLSLDLSEETRNYVPRLQAFKNIIADPDRYGLNLPAIVNTPYFTHIQGEQDIDIEVAAHLAEMPLEEFTALNAGHNQPVILADQGTTFLLPADKVDTFQSNLKKYRGRLTSWQRHERKQGETDEQIARQYDISVAELREMNQLAQGETKDTLIVPGIHASEGLELVTLNTDSPAVLATRVTSKAQSSSQPDQASADTTTVHTVRPGDTLYGLARQYNTTVARLRKLNQLQTNNLSPGKPLRVPDNQTDQQKTASLKRT